ncbi:MAG: AAA family ATPase [Desulfococcaceae bacterium]|nr:AAA family ATPase [Desulfococcaceae bacterium]
MKISKMKYFDQSRHWNLNMMTFKKLTLLVGASGVGKTQILKSILNLRNITKGASVNGLRWEIEFNISNDMYIWQGEFEKISQENETVLIDFITIDNDEEKKDAPKIICEKLYKNGSEVINRDEDKIMFNNVKTVKLPQEKSVVNLLKEEDEVSIIYKNFQKITLHDHSETGALRFSSGDIEVKVEKYKNVEDIQESDESVRTKLYLTSLKSEKIFSVIKDKFIDVFPYVENFKIEPISSKKIPFFLKQTPFIQIKEKGVEHWIDERQISSGMLRTLLHVSELYLGANGTIILVDEFENSLGVNCIDELTNELLIHKRNLQFIITSHHPYIINNINYSNWKIVTRKAGSVTARDATAFNLSKSKHEAFTQLINLDEYSEGVEV